MKNLLCAFLFILPAICSFSQTDSLIKWQVSVEKQSDSIYIIKAKGAIAEGWHLYGKNPSIEGLETVQFAYDYENVANIQLPDFSETPEEIKDPLFDNKKVNVYTGNVSISQQIKINGAIPAVLNCTVSCYLATQNQFQTPVDTFALKLEGGITASLGANKILLSNVDVNNPVNDCGIVSDSGKKSLLSVFFLGFLGGLIALLTPCVFPMIPVTVSFFTKKSGSRKKAIKTGILYGVFIFLIYTLASIPFHILGNVQPEIFNNISTNVWLNIIFFIIFIIFAISFFGFFEITLPSSIAGKADSKSRLGSTGGIFFMALTLVIVSFSCTGPILGSLLVGSLQDGAWPLTFGLAGFGLALALPFALFAIFPNWLASLPKSGGWLDTVKKVLAFAELALAFKFLSNADLVMHWGLLKREVFIGIWILVSLGLALYLFGIIRLPHDYKGMKIGTGRKIAGVIALLFTIYLVPGVFPAGSFRQHLLSGFPPPLSYSIYGKENIKNQGLEANVLNDFQEAVKLAKEEQKPILIDFTGWACVNCRKMEENVWTNPEVYDYIKKNFILVSLYVDDRQLLPVGERFTYTTKDGNEKIIQSIGDKWSAFQTENFTQATQPLYAIIGNGENLMNKPVGYTPDPQKYLAWLQCGKEAFISKR